MMNPRPKIRIICVGTLKEDYWKNAVDSYRETIIKHSQIEIVEVTGEAAPDEMNSPMIKKALDREAASILRRISDKDHVVTLEIGGQKMADSQFASLLCEKQPVFVIGGAMGIAGNVTNRSNNRLSFSGLTFPHQLMRVILLEQIASALKLNY